MRVPNKKVHTKNRRKWRKFCSHAQAGRTNPAQTWTPEKLHKIDRQTLIAVGME